MKVHYFTTAAFGAVLLASIGAVQVAAEVTAASAECLKPLMGYQSGLPMSDAAAMQPMAQQIDETTRLFRTAMKAAESAQVCYTEKMAATKDEAELASLEAGAEEAARIFRLAQTQFEKALDGISGAALSDMAPAAGPDTEVAMGEDLMVASMEQLFDSYMVLERSQAVGEQFTKLKAK